MNTFAINLTRKEKIQFYKTLFTLAIPMILQNAIGSALNFIDTFMISSLSTDVIAGVTAANRVFFIVLVLCYGIFTGGAVLMAQYHGNKDYRNIKRVLGACISIASVFVFIISTICFIYPSFVLSIISSDKNVVLAGSKYLKLAALSYLPMAISSCYASALKSTEKVNIPVIIASISVIINTFLNYIFIFGNFGFERMGAAGAGLATFIARVIELILFLIVIYGFDKEIGGNIKYLFDFDKAFITKFIKTSIPVVGSETIWVLGVTLYSVIFGHMEGNALAATGIIDPAMSIIMFAVWGVNSASGVVIGNKLGAGEEEKVFEYARVLLRLMLIISFVMVISLFVFNRSILSLFPIDDDLMITVLELMFVAILAIPIKNNNFLVITSILRSGGDTKYCFYLEVFSLWFIGIPIAAIAGLVIGLDVVYVYAMMIFSDELVKLILGLKRVYSKKWVKNLAIESH